MNIVMLHKMICEELDGAREYIMIAKKIKEEHPDKAKVFHEMSVAETEHAKNLLNMAESLIKEMMNAASEDASGFLKDTMQIINDDYEERYEMVLHLQNCFKNL